MGSPAARIDRQRARPPAHYALPKVYTAASNALTVMQTKEIEHCVQENKILKHYAVRSFVLTVGYPGRTAGQSFRLFGANKETLGKRGAESLRTLAVRKGISPLALDYAVTK